METECRFPEATTSEFADVDALPCAIGTVFGVDADCPKQLAGSEENADMATPAVGSSAFDAQTRREGRDGVEESQARGSEDTERIENPELAAFERELTLNVDSLLEAMNQASTEVNEKDRELTQAQACYQGLLESLSRLHKDMYAEHGQLINIVWPYQEALAAVEEASQRAQQAAPVFVSATEAWEEARQELRAVEARLAQEPRLDVEQQLWLARCTERVLSRQRERGQRERECAAAVAELKDLQRVVTTRRAQIGESALQRTGPCFRRLQEHQEKLAAEQRKIKVLAEQAQAAKSTYRSSMEALDQISTSVHVARQQFATGELVLAPTNSACSADRATPGSGRPSVDVGNVKEEYMCPAKVAAALSVFSDGSAEYYHPPEVCPEPREGGRTDKPTSLSNVEGGSAAEAGLNPFM